ncbi:hypothetical protein [Sneathiella sp.]|uniref:hypothetical protein n=1 Tax=Sneathiella sp. TaxID=1964365 RepID=UPI003566D13D
MHWAIEHLLVGRTDRQTISKYARGMDKYLGLLLTVSAALLGLAVSEPIVTTNALLGLDGTYSVLSGMVALLEAGQGAAAVMTLAVTLLLPVFLLSTAFDLWYKHELADPKFLRKAKLLKQLGNFWFIAVGSVLAAIYFIQRAPDSFLHFAILYLLVAVTLSKLVLLRLLPMINAVKFVNDTGN